MVADPAATAAPSRAVALPRPIRWIRETLAIGIWIGAAIQLLVLDFGTVIARHFPALAPWFRFRLVLLLLAVSLSWLILGNRRTARFVGYIVAYPLVVILWYGPRSLARNWALFLAFLPAIHTLLRTIRSSFILGTFAAVAGLCVLFDTRNYVIEPSAAFLLVYLVWHFVRRFRFAFLPTAFGELATRVRQAWDALRTQELFRPPHRLSPESPEYKDKFDTHLLTTYVCTTAIYMIGDKVRSVAASRKTDLYLVGSLLYTFAITVVVFAFEYAAVERVWPGSFTGRLSPGFLDFVGLSFSTLMNAGLSPMAATGTLGQALRYTESACTILIVVLIVFVILTTIRERYKDDLEDVVRELKAAADDAGRQMEEHYSLDFVAAELVLYEAHRTIVKWLLEFRHGTQAAKQLCSQMDDAIEAKRIESRDKSIEA